MGVQLSLISWLPSLIFFDQFDSMFCLPPETPAENVVGIPRIFRIQVVWFATFSAFSYHGIQLGLTHLLR